MSPLEEILAQESSPNADLTGLRRTLPRKCLPPGSAVMERVSGVYLARIAPV
jgi:hypothetical protein